jgi:hypothetical protein
MWLSDAGEEAVDVLNRAMVYTHKRLDRSLDAAEELDGWRSRMPAEAVQKFEAIKAAELGPHPDERLSGFTILLEEYGFPEWVAVYNALSTCSHLSASGAQRYIRKVSNGWNASQQPFEAEAVFRLQFSFPLLVDAMAAFDSLVVGRPWKGELERIAAEYGAKITYARRKSKEPKTK